MGILSLILTVVGIVGMLVHYALTAMPAVIVTGILTAVAFIAAYILGTVDMRRQAANGGIRADMFNPVANKLIELRNTLADIDKIAHTNTIAIIIHIIIRIPCSLFRKEIIQRLLLSYVNLHHYPSPQYFPRIFQACHYP